jgi:hypothetical protein
MPGLQAVVLGLPPCLPVEPLPTEHFMRAAIHATKGFTPCQTDNVSTIPVIQTAQGLLRNLEHDFHS